jgi:sRNA-binding carbon storage regulator CsrA
MLTITRKHGETITVHTPMGDVKIVVKDSTGHKAKIGVECDRTWKISRDAPAPPPDDEPE